MATQVIECGAACTVTVQLSPAPPSEENLSDIAFVGSALMLFLAVVWGCKQLLKLVTTDEG